MKKIFVALLVLVAFILIAGSSYSMAAPAPDPTSTPTPTPTVTPQSVEMLYPQIIVVTTEGQVSTLMNVPTTVIPFPGTRSSIIVIDSNGAVSAITAVGVLWYDAGGNPYGY